MISTSNSISSNSIDFKPQISNQENMFARLLVPTYCTFDYIFCSHAESPKNIPIIEVYGNELPSPPLKHIKISFPAGSYSPLYMYSLIDDNYFESPSIERHLLCERKSDNISPSLNLFPYFMGFTINMKIYLNTSKCNTHSKYL